MESKFLFLGTGASAGVPVVGCSCPTCSSLNAKNQRLRPSGLLKIENRLFLIDVGPDFRSQALKNKITHLDGLLLTHPHYDHIAGIDELRVFYFKQKKPLPCLLSPESLDNLKERYKYLFQPIGEASTLSAQIEFQILDQEIGQAEFCGLKIGYCSYFQGGTLVTGWRLGDFAYLTDVKDYDETVFIALKGVKKLVLNALRKEPSPLHLTIDEAVAFGKKVGVEKLYLTHISHAIEHGAVEKELPLGVHLAYDGLEISFEYP